MPPKSIPSGAQDAPLTKRLTLKTRTPSTALHSSTANAALKNNQPLINFPKSVPQSSTSLSKIGPKQKVNSRFLPPKPVKKPQAKGSGSKSKQGPALVEKEKEQEKLVFDEPEDGERDEYGNWIPAKKVVAPVANSSAGEGDQEREKEDEEGSALDRGEPERRSNAIPPISQLSLLRQNDQGVGDGFVHDKAAEARSAEGLSSITLGSKGQVNIQAASTNTSQSVRKTIYPRQTLQPNPFPPVNTQSKKTPLFLSSDSEPDDDSPKKADTVLPDPINRPITRRKRRAEYIRNSQDSSQGEQCSPPHSAHPKSTVHEGKNAYDRGPTPPLREEEYKSDAGSDASSFPPPTAAELLATLRASATSPPRPSTPSPPLSGGEEHQPIQRVESRSSRSAASIKTPKTYGTRYKRVIPAPAAERKVETSARTERSVKKKRIMREVGPVEEAERKSIKRRAVTLTRQSSIERVPVPTTISSTAPEKSADPITPAKPKQFTSALRSVVNQSDATGRHWAASSPVPDDIEERIRSDPLARTVRRAGSVQVIPLEDLGPFSTNIRRKEVDAETDLDVTHPDAEDDVPTVERTIRKRDKARKRRAKAADPDEEPDDGELAISEVELPAADTGDEEEGEENAQRSSRRVKKRKKRSNVAEGAVVNTDTGADETSTTANGRRLWSRKTPTPDPDDLVDHEPPPRRRKRKWRKHKERPDYTHLIRTGSPPEKISRSRFIHTRRPKRLLVDDAQTDEDVNVVPLDTQEDGVLFEDDPPGLPNFDYTSKWPDVDGLVDPLPRDQTRLRAGFHFLSDYDDPAKKVQDCQWDADEYFISRAIAREEKEKEEEDRRRWKRRKAESWHYSDAKLKLSRSETTGERVEDWAKKVDRYHPSHRKSLPSQNIKRHYRSLDIPTMVLQPIKSVSFRDYCKMYDDERAHPVDHTLIKKGIAAQRDAFLRSKQTARQRREANIRKRAPAPVHFMDSIDEPIDSAPFSQLNPSHHQGGRSVAAGYNMVANHANRRMPFLSFTNRSPTPPIPTQNRRARVDVSTHDLPARLGEPELASGEIGASVAPSSRASYAGTGKPDEFRPLPLPDQIARRAEASAKRSINRATPSRSRGVLQLSAGRGGLEDDDDDNTDAEIAIPAEQTRPSTPATNRVNDARLQPRTLLRRPSSAHHIEENDPIFDHDFTTAPNSPSSPAAPAPHTTIRSNPPQSSPEKVHMLNGIRMTDTLMDQLKRTSEMFNDFRPADPDAADTPVKSAGKLGAVPRSRAKGRRGGSLSSCRGRRLAQGRLDVWVTKSTEASGDEGEGADRSHSTSKRTRRKKLEKSISDSEPEETHEKHQRTASTRKPPVSRRQSQSRAIITHAEKPQEGEQGDGMMNTDGQTTIRVEKISSSRPRSRAGKNNIQEDMSPTQGTISYSYAPRPTQVQHAETFTQAVRQRQLEESESSPVVKAITAPSSPDALRYRIEKLRRTPYRSSTQDKRRMSSSGRVDQVQTDDVAVSSTGGNRVATGTLAGDPLNVEMARSEPRPRHSETTRGEEAQPSKERKSASARAPSRAASTATPRIGLSRKHSRFPATPVSQLPFKSATKEDDDAGAVPTLDTFDRAQRSPSPAATNSPLSHTNINTQHSLALPQAGQHLPTAPLSPTQLSRGIRTQPSRFKSRITSMSMAEVSTTQKNTDSFRTADEDLSGVDTDQRLVGRTQSVGQARWTKGDGSRVVDKSTSRVLRNAGLEIDRPVSRGFTELTLAPKLQRRSLMGLGMGMGMGMGTTEGGDDRGGGAVGVGSGAVSASASGIRGSGNRNTHVTGPGRGVPMPMPIHIGPSKSKSKGLGGIRSVGGTGTSRIGGTVTGVRSFTGGQGLVGRTSSARSRSQFRPLTIPRSEL